MQTLSDIYTMLLSMVSCVRPTLCWLLGSGVQCALFMFWFEGEVKGVTHGMPQFHNIYKQVAKTLHSKLT